jgi:hypothetical protein
MYRLPVDAPVSCSWQCHRDRDPPSSEPGTDYASAYGTPIAAAGAGWISDVKSDPGDATGRFIQLSLDDGRTVRYLHLSTIWRGYGARVVAGEGLGESGASGYGNDWHYGPHVHTTLWNGPAWSGPTIDFALYAGEEDEDDMPLDANNDYAAFSNMLQRALRFDTRPEGNGASSEFGPTIWERLNGLESGLGAKIDADPEPTPEPCPDKSSALSTPAWIAGFFLGLIGLVEVIRLVVDVLT